MKTYTMQRCAGRPDWDNIPALAIDTLLWTDVCDVRAWAQVAYGDDALHIRLRAQETDIRCCEQGPLGMPCLDSCLEFFFSPAEGDLRYFNIEFNPGGCVYCGFGAGRGQSVRLMSDGVLAQFCPETERTEDGWAVAYRVPYSFIRLFFPDFRAEPGRAIRANCYKCGDKTVHPHYLSWNPVASQTPEFHRPQDFGAMVFA